MPLLPRMWPAFFVVLWAAVVQVQCDVPRADDIDRVQPGFVSKAIFQTGDAWHYRRTIADATTTNSWIIRGSGDIQIDRIVFEIQESLLLARKPYNAIPGAGLDALPGALEFNGPVLAAWPIDSHFDIIRNYDELTGRETNEIVENTADRPWYERQYMRVDFSTNLVEDSFLGAYSQYWTPVQFASTGSFWQHITENPTNPFASRFSEDYIEITDNVLLSMDVFACSAFFGQYRGLSGETCGFGEAKVRHSFRRVRQPNDFEPRFLPDSVVVRDENGEPVQDPDTNEVVRESLDDRFGIFRNRTPTYDRGYGFTEDGRLFRAQIFDIWEESVDDAGAALSYADRDEKPIIYYLNAEYPERYRDVAREVAEEYNRVFKNMVANLKGVSPAEVRDMFEIRDNHCREDRIIETVLSRPELLRAIERAVCSQDDDGCAFTADDPAALRSELEDQIGIGNLEVVCTSLEEATMDPETGISGFEWQRIGDLRHNMVVWLSEPQPAGWLGFGPAHSDALTGEVISATAYIQGAPLEVDAAEVADYICFMNDEPGCGVADIIYGRDIRRQIGRVERRVIEMATQRPGKSAVSELARRLNGGVGPGHSTTRLPTAPTADATTLRLQRLAGHPLEQRFITDEFKIALSNGTWLPGRPEPPWLQDLAHLGDAWEAMNPYSRTRTQQRQVLNAGGFCFLEADFDPHFAGLALDLRDLSREERFAVIAGRLAKYIMLHEIGHNLGLSHNFQGTYDALNYDANFWMSLDQAPEQQIENSLDEYRHTTVMEYMSSKGLFADFLGSYDEAAIRFAYANQVQVFTSENFRTEGGDALEGWTLYNDYRKIPDHLCGGSCATPAARTEVLTSRDWVTFDPADPPPNEVPYMFCDSLFDRRTPFCATFDYGSSLSEIQANYYNMWKLYFPFNNFSRGRLSPLGWNISSAFRPMSLMWNFMDVTSQYYQILQSTDPAFEGTDLQADMVGTLLNSMNIMTEVLTIPAPGRYCPNLPGDGTSIGQEIDRPVYLPGITNGCDPEVDIASLRSRSAIDLAMGDGRPEFLDFTNEFEEQQIWYIGSAFDKLDALILWGWTIPRQYRFNYDLDERNFYLSTYRLFEPEMREFYGQLLDLDFLISIDFALELGSFWCRNPEHPIHADLGYLEARRMFEVSAESFESFPESSDDCLDPGVIYPSYFINLTDQALLVAHAVLSSDLDQRLDLGKNLKIWGVGAYDEPSSLSDESVPLCTELAARDVDCLCSYTDPLTGVEYRGLNLSFEGRSSLACNLIALAENRGSRYADDPDFSSFDIWRIAVERLEANRTLYRIFQDR
ncbi:MAG: zinc-dependent metalloprotease [Myxococcota bacterium]